MAPMHFQAAFEPLADTIPKRSKRTEEEFVQLAMERVGALVSSVGSPRAYWRRTLECAEARARKRP